MYIPRNYTYTIRLHTAVASAATDTQDPSVHLEKITEVEPFTAAIHTNITDTSVIYVPLYRYKFWLRLTEYRECRDIYSTVCPLSSVTVFFNMVIEA